MRKKVNITTSTFGTYSPKPISLLDQKGLDIYYNKLFRKLTSNELIEQARGAAAVIAGTELYSKEVLDELSDLKVISRLGVGTDNINLNVAKEKGIKIYTTQTSPAQAVVELSLGLLLDLVRKITLQNNDVKNGIWEKSMGNLLYGKTLGIIGLGSIGKTLVKLVKGFNFNIMAFDIYEDNTFAQKHGLTYCDLDSLIKQSDIISIHLNLTVETNNLINSKRISLLKPESILINTSRGEIIDEDALYKALKNKQILGAGLDVFKEEPYSGSLVELENVILTPHIGSYAKEIRIKMETEAAENLLRGINEK